LNSGSEKVVTVDLILTVKKPNQREETNNVHELSDGDTKHLIDEAIQDLSVDVACNPSYVYARILSKAIQKHLVLDSLHLSDVLIALRNAGYDVDPETGFLSIPKQ
jgi:hypothetical protein